MRSLRLSALLEHEGSLPIDEAVALAWKLLEDVPSHREPRLVSPIGVLLRSDGSVGVVSPLSQRARLADASETERARCGRLSAWVPDEHRQPVPTFTDAGRFNFGVMAALFTCLTGQRPFDEAPAPGAAGAPVFAELVRRLGSTVPEPLARLLRTELLWHLEPAPGARHWLRKPLSREAVRSTLLSFVGDAGPQDSLATLGLRVEAALSKQAQPDVPALTTAVQAGDEASRLVLADAYEERGQPNEAEWLRLESRVQRAAPREASSLLRRLAELRPLLPARFIAEVSRAPVEGCSVRFGLKCPRRWEELERTEMPEQRYCAMCDAPVFFVLSAEAAREAGRAGRCVAVAATAREPDGSGIDMGMPLVPEFDLPQD
ncbi:MAG: hypothetical protein SFW67_26240 [Myxococcaceae bacterium]|nr:hypothetical protein [Myxococcaceae bacterium]